MPIQYKEQNKYFRSKAAKPILQLPCDPARAEKNGLEKAYTEYPSVDGPVGKLVAAIARKNWDVPGVTCEFDIYGKEEKPLHHLYRLTGGVQGLKWEIQFCRPVYTVDNKNVLCEPSLISIPGHELDVDQDGCSVYYPYVGDDWYEDEESFQARSKINAKQDGLPRTYLLYELHSDSFYHTGDRGREYERNENDPVKYPAEDVYGVFGAFIEKLTAKIDAMPDVCTDPYEAWEKEAYIEPQHVPEELKPFYVVTHNFGEPNTRGVVVWSANGHLFDVSDEAKENYPTSPVMDHGFQFGFALTPFQAQSGRWGHDPAQFKTSLIKVNLKYANDIYVVDEKPLLVAENYLKPIAAAEERDLNDDENGVLRQVLGRTLVPLAEYKNNYEYPMFLIGRPLCDDEAEHVTYKIKDDMGKLTSPSQDGYHKRLYRVMKNAL